MSQNGKKSWPYLSVAGVVLAGAGLSLAFGSWPSLLGVLLCGLTSLLALWLKGWAVRKGLQAALVTVGVSFAVRLFTIGAGMAVAMRFSAELPLVAGFFGAFLPLLTIEMLHVHQSAPRPEGAEVRSAT